MKNFILELGKDFLFVAEELRSRLGTTIFTLIYYFIIGHCSV